MPADFVGASLREDGITLNVRATATHCSYRLASWSMPPDRGRRQVDAP